jgi:hypothetical protein
MRSTLVSSGDLNEFAPSSLENYAKEHVVYEYEGWRSIHSRPKTVHNRGCRAVRSRSTALGLFLAIFSFFFRARHERYRGEGYRRFLLTPGFHSGAHLTQKSNSSGVAVSCFGLMIGE